MHTQFLTRLTNCSLASDWLKGL